jgi:hypothetical protein
VEEVRAGRAVQAARGVGRVLDRLLRRGRHVVAVRDQCFVDRGEHTADDRHAEGAADLPGELVH